MAESFRQTNNICSITVLLDTLKLQGHLVPSPLHVPTEWEDLHEEAVEVVECIDFTGKNRIVTTGWGEEFEDSNEEKASEKAGMIADICGMISFEELLGEINKVEEQPEIDEKMGFMFFSSSVNHMTRSGMHYQISSSLSAGDKGKGVENLPMPEMTLEESKILDQLKKTQANITLWGLFMSSQLHRNVLIKLLTGPTVSPSTTPEEAVNLVGSLTSTRMLSFLEEEIPKIGPNHNHALNIFVEVMGKVVPLSLVDNGSALNVCPLRTFRCLGGQRR